MKILHFYHKHDALVAQYVATLSRAMAGYADVKQCHTVGCCHKELAAMHPDIVHIHGCWHFSSAIVAHMARKSGARVVLSPHGQLEPWVIRQRYLGEKLPKMIFFQRSVVKKAYALITMGRMEEGCLQRLRWNSRRETVLNSLVTDTTTAEEMGSKVYAVYRKVLDSNLWPLMADDTLKAMRGVVKAGQTGDHRWLADDEYEACKHIDDEELRKVLLYAHQENLSSEVKRGISVLGLDRLGIDAANVPFYYPAGHQAPPPLATNDSQTDEERLLAMLVSMRKFLRHHRLAMCHVVALAGALRNSHADEDKLVKMLVERHLMKFAKTIMQVLADLTGLEEGFMPVPAREGRKAYNIEDIITNNLTI